MFNYCFFSFQKITVTTQDVCTDYLYSRVCTNPGGPCVAHLKSKWGWIDSHVTSIVCRICMECTSLTSVSPLDSEAR